MKMHSDIRLDVYLNKEYGFSRNYSKEIIEKGFISVNEKVVLKSAFKIKSTDVVKVNEQAIPKYVSRGGLKLEKAINLFSINIDDAVCLDVGASTGGFTDCMLQNGAKKVYAIDVGTSQLHSDLLLDKRVVSFENTDIRNVDKNLFNETLQFVSIDVSFISITKILENIFNILDNNSEVVALIKPQFEAGKDKLNKNGAVTNIKTHKKVLTQVLNFIQNIGFFICNLTYSPIKKNNGNIEYLVHIKKMPTSNKFDFTNINKIVESAFLEL